MELAARVYRGRGCVGRPAGSVEGQLAPEGAAVWGVLGRGRYVAGRGVHLCEGLQGLEPVGGIVVLKRVQTVACGCRDPCGCRERARESERVIREKSTVRVAEFLSLYR